MARQFKRGQEGFTLIEIISVLVLLGILAAVAVPRFMDMQAAARERAAQATVNEIQARINQTFANNLLLGASCMYARTGTPGTGEATIAKVVNPVLATSGGPLADIPNASVTLATGLAGGPAPTWSFVQGGTSYNQDASSWTTIGTAPVILTPSCG